MLDGKRLGKILGACMRPGLWLLGGLLKGLCAALVRAAMEKPQQEEPLYPQLVIHPPENPSASVELHTGYGPGPGANLNSVAGQRKASDLLGGVGTAGFTNVTSLVVPRNPFMEMREERLKEAVRQNDLGLGNDRDMGDDTFTPPAADPVLQDPEQPAGSFLMPGEWNPESAEGGNEKRGGLIDEPPTKGGKGDLVDNPLRLPLNRMQQYMDEMVEKKKPAQEKPYENSKSWGDALEDLGAGKDEIAGQGLGGPLDYGDPGDEPESDDWGDWRF